MNLSLLAAVCGLIVLIIDTKTAVHGAQEGIAQCIRVVIPSLFPFFLISGLFCQSMQQCDLSFLSPIRKLCRIPNGSESLMIIGLLGGYPVGAREIFFAYDSGRLSRSDAQRMLGFCNNAGPSFIFGIIALQFSNKSVGMWLFLIQVVSAVLTAAILPGGSVEKVNHTTSKQDFISIFNSSIRSIASVCGWVIIFRIILTFLHQWILLLLPDYIAVVITGILELANGSIQLNRIQNDGLRMIISSGILSLGGMCVYLQTLSVTKGLGTGMYFPGKLIQCSISILLSGIVQCFIFRTSRTNPFIYLLISFIIIFCVCIVINLPFFKKKSSFSPIIDV